MVDAGSRKDWIVSQCSGTVLDIGSAGGVVFEGSGLDVTLLDINEFPGFRRVVGDAHDLPFEDNSFDCCVLAEILEHVHNPILVLREAARVARKKVVFTVPDEFHWAAAYHPLRTLDQAVKEEHMTPEELFWRGNARCTRLNDLKQAFHNRRYDIKLLRSHLDYLGLPYKVEVLAGGGWSWFAGTITKNGMGV